MEVHHHTHSSHGKKNWKTYFWEFLMLFLAVFCGFLAEYQLEHMIEHQREKKYAVSLLEDLKKDTADFNFDIPAWKRIMSSIDTIRQEIEKSPDKRNALLLYKHAAYARNFENFEYHDRTIEQLKNGGNFRLIRKTALADSLMDYDVIIKSVLKSLEASITNIYETVNFSQDKLFNSRFYYLRTRGNAQQLDSAFKASPEFFIIPPGKEADLFEYYNHLEFYIRMTKNRQFCTDIYFERQTTLSIYLKQNIICNK